MEKTPRFIKEFSKEKSHQEREQTARDIKEKRVEYFVGKKDLSERQTRLQESIENQELILKERLKNIDNLNDQISEITNSGLTKILNYFKLKKLQADLVVGQKTYEELKQQQDLDKTEQLSLSEKLEDEKNPLVMQESKKILDNFYQNQKEKWVQKEYSKEDIAKYFSEEHLSSLSLEDYVLLLKRFPREMVAHVTRQGVRDHIGMMYHTAGEGEYAEGFLKMVEDGRLRSPLGVYLTENEKEKAITRFLRLDNFENKDEALGHLATLTDVQQYESGSYADRMAIHFATEEVADSYYGSEKGNEIFIAYPSAFIASQYYFNGQLKEGNSGYWNDQWIWANEEHGIDLNAGLIFIPEEARVDKNTGSRYELDENKNPIKNLEYLNILRKVFASDDFDDFAKQVMEITGKLSKKDEQNLLPSELELFNKLEPFRQKLENNYGIKDRRLQNSIFDYHTLLSLTGLKNEPVSTHSPESVIEESLEKSGILFTEAKNTISSKQFWEEYFAKNQSKRPSKIIYYKGEDPTGALRQWRKEQGIDKTTKDENLGFSERSISRDAPQAVAGLSRFKNLAEKIIEDYFAKK